MERSSTLVKKINIPLNPSNSKPRGFAFVEFKSKNSALKTVKELNEKVFRGRKIEAVMAVDQRLYQNNKNKDVQKNEIEKIETEDNTEELQDDIEKVSEIEKTSEVKDIKVTNNINKDKGIVFVKNVDYDINGDDFTEHFKTFGKTVWAKLCMRDLTTHRGTGFVKFKDEQDSVKLIEMSKGLKEKPEEKVLIDPLNILEIKNRRIEILPVLTKDKLPSKEPIVKPNLSKIKKLKLADLLISDYKDKRNFKLALMGMPVTDDNIDGKDEFETEKRRRHMVN